MSNDLCLLITVLNGDSLLRCALKIKSGLGKYGEYPMEHKDAIHEMLPLHVKSCGPIVDIEEIFEIAD